MAYFPEDQWSDFFGQDFGGGPGPAPAHQSQQNSLLSRYVEYTQEDFREALDRVDTMRDPDGKLRLSEDVDQSIRSAMKETGMKVPVKGVLLRAMPDKSVIAAANDIAEAVGEIEIFSDTYTIHVPRGKTINNLEAYYTKMGIEHAWRYLQYRYHGGPPPEYAEQLDSLTQEVILALAAEVEAGREDGAAEEDGPLDVDELDALLGEECPTVSADLGRARPGPRRPPLVSRQKQESAAAEGAGGAGAEDALEADAAGDVAADGAADAESAAAGLF